MGYYDTDYLEHHGVLGQKWGVRRYQNADGSLTPAGKKRVYAQGADGGYESAYNRRKRAIDAAKYSKDIERNQKKLDRAYARGNEKKIAKYTKAEKILNTNKDIMTKDLSPEEIKVGENYIKMTKAVAIGTIIGGPVIGIGAATALRLANNMSKDERAVAEQERKRRAKYDAEQYEKQLKQESEQRAKNFDKYVDENGGKLTAENLPSHDRDGKPTYMLTDKQKQQYADEYNKTRAAEAKKKDKSINDVVKRARETGMYDMEFLERNLDVDDNTGKQLEGKAMDDAYRKYLKEVNG